jgi:hypothetical protein
MAQVWALVPVAFFSKGNAAGASHRTEVRVLGSANAYGAPFATLWALFPCATIKRPNFYLHVTVPLPDLACYVRALRASFAANRHSRIFNKAC